MRHTNSAVRFFQRGAIVPLLAFFLAAPTELFAGRPSGGARGGGGGSSGSSASRASAGSSVRQSHVQGSQGSGVNRSSVQSAQPSRSATPSQTQNVDRNTNANRNTNVNRNTNINVDQDVNVHGNFEGGDIENVSVGEEHAYVKTEEHRVWVGEGEVHVYEDNDAWRVAAGVAGVMAIGAMIATPPPVYAPVVVGPTSYYYADGAYYTQVYSGGEVAYQVVAPPVGAVVEVLPGGCVDHRVGNVIYKNCGGYYYQPQGANWVVVQL